MESNILISVIIPTYKPQEYIFQCLDSLTAQTFDNDKYEVIVILNGCCEPYYTEIDRYIKANSRNIILIHTGSGGVSNARNIGLDAARGKYIAFIDDDDYISPSYLESLYEKANDSTIVMSDVFVFKDGSDLRIDSRMSEVYNELSHHGRQDYIKARRLFFSVWMKLIPASIIRERRFDTKFSVGEDCLFLFLISDRMGHVDFASKDAVYYRRLRQDSAMGKIGRGKKSVTIRNDIRMIIKYTQIYLSGLFRYSFFFFLTRIRGAIHI